MASSPAAAATPHPAPALSLFEGIQSTVAAAPPVPVQQSLDDLGTPLAQVTFVVIDLETTGASPNGCAVTEVGALKLRGGELLGTFDTLVNPGQPIPPTITVLTGITEAMVLPAPPIGEVLPALLEFIGDAVIVGHNVRFDVSFINAACAAHGYEPLGNQRVDTLGLARRLLRDEVPNLRLSTLARHLRAPTEPVHRAYADAAATAEVFHSMLERAGSLGVLGLDDLLALPSMRAHPSSSKLKLTTGLPRKPGVYLMRDRAGRVLYVGKASNLRARVRSYFGSDDRRKVPQLLRETEAIDHLVCRSAFEAEIRELRLIQRLMPRFNRQSKMWRRYTYLKLTDERFPRLMVTRSVREDAGLYIGPLPSSRFAHTVREAIETAVPLRRCNRRVGKRSAIVADAPCVPAQLGVATCPCRGGITDDAYEALVDRVRNAVQGADASALLDPLTERMNRLAEHERFEEAATTRDRLAALTRALERRRTVEALRAATYVQIQGPDGPVELRNGRYVLADGPGATAELSPAATLRGVCPPDEIDEMLVVARWLERVAERSRVVRVDGTLAWPLPSVPRFEVANRSRSA